MTGRANLILAAAAGLFIAGAASAQKVSDRNAFQIGTGSGASCTAQSMLTDPALADMFDRGYRVACRDAVIPVGSLYALTDRRPDPFGRLAALRADKVACGEAQTVDVEGLGAALLRQCRLRADGVPWHVYEWRQGNIHFAAEGLAGYDSALRLGLRSLVADREVEGEVSIATIGIDDPVAFARVQAGTLDPRRRLAEAYRRNNAGYYAEAAEFFSNLGAGDASPLARAEALVNQALQVSNLGRFAEADTLFAESEALAASSPVAMRRLRNYRAMHLLNQGLPAEALEQLDRPVAARADAAAIRELVISPDMARRLSSETPGAGKIEGRGQLTDTDKIIILDGQAAQLRGTSLRLLGRGAEAVDPLLRALASLTEVGGGQLAETSWLRAQILGELAAIAEERGDPAEARRLHLAAIELLEVEYPGSSALLSARGRQAGFLVRAGQPDEAIPIYRQIVESLAAGTEGGSSLRATLAPYFRLLAERGEDPQAVADMFVASQLLVRPGVAQTQAVLARELSGGSDEASRLFRQSVALTRDIQGAQVQLARLEGSGPLTNDQAARAETLRMTIESLSRDQVATQASLARFPRFRVVASRAIDLPGLRSMLQPGEAYYKMLVLDEDAYGIWISPTAARAFRLGATPGELEDRVDSLRATIVTVRDGQQVTFPFDVELGWRLFQDLFAPVAGELGATRHLVFEPDGAMLRLPPNLLVTDPGGIAAYRARAARPGEDGFDFRGIEWMGRDREISTAVSATGFRDVRQAPASSARADYLGFGENAPAQPGQVQAAATRSGFASGGCTWPIALWNRPIQAGELITARRAIAGATGSAEAQIVTGESFTDTSIKQRADLDQYRVLHFATHGLVGGPAPECPSAPALLTSFGSGDSDGLLTFAEIFDLRLDADLVILSACDTAGGASLEATREAGLSSGGDLALDGLVRAFVGAGSRVVVASHWPVPDDYDATEKLISGLFEAAPGTGTAAALRAAQQRLMDDRNTSHPFYWSGFAVVGDGKTPVIPASSMAQLAR